MPFRHLLPTIFLILLGATSVAQAGKKSPPAAPTKLKVTPVGVNAFKLKWKDNSDNETGWDVLVSLKGGKPQHYTYIPTADITSYTVFTNDLPGFGLVFQLAAYRGEPGKEIVSDPTPMVSVKALSPAIFGKPSELTAKALDDSRVRLQWADNSTTEAGYQIEFKPAKAKTWELLGTVQPELKFSVVASSLIPRTKYKFRVRASRAKDGKISKFSNVASARTKSLGTPRKLAVTPEAEGSFKFKWKDTSFAETGFELQWAVGDGDFAPYTTFNGYNIKKTRLKTVLSDFPLDRDLRFRIRTFYDSGTGKTYSGFSNTVSTRSTSLNPPTAFAVTARTDTSLSLKWADNSKRETNYQIDFRKAGTKAFTTRYTGEDGTTLKLTDLAPATSYEVRIRAVFSSFFSSPAQSAFSGIVKAQTRQGIVGDVNPQLVAGSDFSYQVNLSSLSGLTSLAVSGLPAGLTFNQSTRTISGNLNQEAGFPLVVTARFSDGSTSTRTINVANSTTPAKPTNLESIVATNSFITLRWKDNSNQEVGYLVEYREVGASSFMSGSAGANRQTFTIDGLMPDLTYEVRVSATGSTAGTRSAVSSLMVHNAASPVIESTFGAVSVAASSSLNVSADLKFSDPDTASAARFVTTKGNFDIIFFPAAAPLTVDNFIDYMDAGQYDNMFFHRSPVNFVVQGGGYKYSMANGFTEVVKFPAVVNEPGISNKRGTVAMAKLGGNANSATSEWFVNVKDNSANLDIQNGGFTVFGRVPETGMAVVQAINNLPLATYQFPFSPLAKTFDDVPVDAVNAPAALDPATLVKVTFAGPAPILTYAVSSLNPAVATATVSGSDITINGVGSGSTSIQVTATDLDGQSVSQNIPVTVP